MSTTNQSENLLFNQFIQLVNEKYIEYSYADLFANELQVSQKKLNEAVKKITGRM